MSGHTASSRTARAGRPEARALAAAEGYAALDMPFHALVSLRGVGSECEGFGVHRLRGELLLRVGRDDAAVASLLLALQREPDNLPVLLMLAAAEARLGETDAALCLLERADRNHPGEPAVPLALARLLVARGEAEPALAWLRKAVAICPDLARWAGRQAEFAPLKNHAGFAALLAAAG